MHFFMGLEEFFNIFFFLSAYRDDLYFIAEMWLNAIEFRERCQATGTTKSPEIKNNEFSFQLVETEGLISVIKHLVKNKRGDLFTLFHA